MILALAGNPNSGKTTLFNQLTGSNQHVGNFPGVPVDKKEGTIRDHKNVTVVDLPGIYSLSPYTSEEIVTRDFLLTVIIALPFCTVFHRMIGSWTNVSKHGTGVKSSALEMRI